ncbi:MAG: TIR domain-containing protein [Bryobacteraceae bacterium]|nr:TIR domain-containing protein [Bryobacteraceae bacterium]
MPSALNVFCSYSHKDADVCQELVDHLRGMEQDGLIRIWFDGNLRPSDDWSTKISDHLDRADLVLLLTSANFFGSKYCGLEMERALKRKDSHGVIPVPVTLARYNLPASLNKFQCILADKPVSTWPARNDALYDAARQIRGLIAHHWPDLVPAERLAHPDRDKLKALFYHLCDRGPQREALRRSLDYGKVNPRRPFVIVMQGGIADAHPWYLDRLEKEVLPQMLRQKPARLSPLEWPEYNPKQDPGDLFAPAWADCLPAQQTWSTAADLNEAIRLCGPVSIVHSARGAESWGRNGHKLLNAYLQFWKQWPLLPEGHRIIPILSLRFGNDEELNERIRRCLKTTTFNADGVVLPPFPKVGRADVEHWIEHERVRPHFASPPAAILKLDLIFHEDTPTMPMQTLAEIHLPRFLNSL